MKGKIRRESSRDEKRRSRDEERPRLLSADELEGEAFERVLLMGAPKIGKSTLVIGTSPGPVHVVLTEDKTALLPAKRRGMKFTWEQARHHDAIIQAIQTAKREAKKGAIATLVFDSFTAAGDKVLEQCMQSEKHGKAAYGQCNRRLKHIANQLLLVPCHLVVITHYVDTGSTDEDGTPKTGEGVAPLLPGQSRAMIPAIFPNVVFMDYHDKRRVLYTGPRGAWGPGCRSLRETRILNADIESGKKNIGIRALFRAFREDATTAEK